MEAQNNGLWDWPDIKELEDLCLVEVMLVSQIIPFMFTLGKAKLMQHGLKG